MGNEILWGLVALVAVTNVIIAAWFLHRVPKRPPDRYPDCFSYNEPPFRWRSPRRKDDES